MRKKITLLQMNDLHGYLDLHKEIYYDDNGIRIAKAGGFPRIFTLAERIRKEAGEILFLDNGDTLHGTYEAVKSRGAALIPLLNRLKLDAMTFHWDIAYGPQVLKEREQELSYPILAINAYHEDTHELFMSPYLMKEINDVRVAVIGVACNIIDKTMPKSFSEGLYFTDGLMELPGYIEEVREKGAELIVVLSHMGFPQDVEILRKVPGIDVCLSGHTHNRLHEAKKIKDTWIIQSGSHGSFLGRLDLTLEDRKIVHVDHALLDVSEDLPEDPETRALMEEVMAPHRSFLDTPVGETKVLLHRGTSLESPMDNLLLSALLHETGAEVAFSNGWRYGVPIEPGTLTMRDLHQIIPVNPPVSTVKLTGQEILDMIEDNLEHTYSRNPLDQMGGYLKRALGIKAYLKIENEKDKRIQEIFVGSERLDPERTYTACYVTSQGVPERFGTDHRKLETKAIDALVSYLKKEAFDLDEVRSFILI